jgi:nitrogen regulatory protein P-II 1
MKEIKAIIQPFMLEQVCAALREIEGLPGITVSQVMGWGKSRAAGARDTVQEAGVAFARKTKVEVVASAALATKVVAAIEGAARTGNVGDGKIFVYDVEEVVKIRTGERGEEAI